MNNQKILVVGGGILGLTIAYILSQKGEKVTVVEKDKRFGGLATSLHIYDFEIEAFYHHFFGGDKYIFRLVKELKLEEKLKSYSTTSGIFKDGKLYDFSNSIDILKFPLLGILDRIRLGFISLYLQKNTQYKKYQGITALEWCRRYYGDKITSIIWEPLLKGKFGKYAESIEMSWLWARIFDRSSSRHHPLSNEYLWYLDGGLSTLVSKLEKHIKENGGILLKNTELVNYQYKDRKHVVKLSNKENSDVYNKVISTIPGDIFLKKFNIKNQLADQIRKIKYIGVICFTLVLKEKFMPYYWLNIADDSSPLLAVIEHTNLIDKKYYNNHNILYLVKYIATDDKVFSYSKEKLLNKYIKYLEKINPTFDRSWIIKSYLTKAKNAQHIVHSGYAPPDSDIGIDNLFFLNYTQIFPHDRGVNFAIKQAYDFIDKLDKN